MARLWQLHKAENMLQIHSRRVYLITVKSQKSINGRGSTLDLTGELALLPRPTSGEKGQAVPSTKPYTRSWPAGCALICLLRFP